MDRFDTPEGATQSWEAMLLAPEEIRRRITHVTVTGGSGEDEMSKVRSGFRVVGMTLSYPPVLHCWAAPTREHADKFASFMASKTGEEYDVLEYVGSWRRTALPVEFMPAKKNGEPSDG